MGREKMVRCAHLSKLSVVRFNFHADSQTQIAEIAEDFHVGVEAGEGSEDSSTGAGVSGECRPEGVNDRSVYLEANRVGCADPKRWRYRD